MTYTEDGVPIHLIGCMWENAAHNSRCCCAGLRQGPGHPIIPAVLAEDVERARHAAPNA